MSIVMSNSESHNVNAGGSEGHGHGHGDHNSGPLDEIQLKWTSHQPTIFNIFQDLYNSENLVDVTLAAEGKYLRAHKIILSACSPYFQELLSVDCSTKHPILFMSPEVKFHELRAILNYMYKGEAQIPQENLSSLLRLAESLQIRGLADTEKPSTVPAPPVSQEWSRLGQGQGQQPSVKTVNYGGQLPGHQIDTQPIPIITSISSISNQLDISTTPTTNSAKRRRLGIDPISDGNYHQNVEPLILRTLYNEPQLYSSPSQGQIQEIPQVHNVNMAQTQGVGSREFEMEDEDIQIIEEQEVKVEMDELIGRAGNVTIGLLEDSNSCSRSLSAEDDLNEEEERNGWYTPTTRSGGGQNETAFQIPSTSSPYLGQLTPDAELTGLSARWKKNDEKKLAFVLEVIKFPIVLEKSHGTRTLSLKKQAFEELRRRVVESTGEEITEAQVKKRIQNMRAEIRNRVDTLRNQTPNQNYVLKEWEKEFLALLKLSLNGSFYPKPIS